MTDAKHTTPNPTALLLAKTGCATPDEVHAKIVASQREIMNLAQYNQILYTRRQPFVEKAEKHERRAGSLGIAALSVASFTPVGAAVLGAAAVGQLIRGAPARATANAYNREIAYNTGEIHQDTTFIQQGQQALAEAHQAAGALQAAQTARLQSPGMC